MGVDLPHVVLVLPSNWYRVISVKMLPITALRKVESVTVSSTGESKNSWKPRSNLKIFFTLGLLTKAAVT